MHESSVHIIYFPLPWGVSDGSLETYETKNYLLIYKHEIQSFLFTLYSR